MFSYRKNYFYIFVICSILLSIALYIQYIEHIEPCLLCMIQRLLYILLGITALIACLCRHTPLSQRIFNRFATVFVLLGLLTTARQVWLQHLTPSEKASSVCLPGYKYLISSGAWSTLFKSIISGASDCAQTHWTLLGLSMAEWSLILFVLFAIIIWRQFKYRP